MPLALSRLFLPLRACLVLVLGCWTSVGSQADTLSLYRLGAGDVIQVYVFDEPELSLEYTLSDAGTISYPFLGEIHVRGMTPGELEQAITSGLKGPYLVDPKVNVTIRQYRQFFIHGAVRNSGGYPYQPGLTLRKAITLAGGLDDNAIEKKIYVIRDHEQDGQRQLIGMDDPVNAGDTVTVEKGFF